jgi:Flp pilus assembly pilin Flp
MRHSDRGLKRRFRRMAFFSRSRPRSSEEAQTMAEYAVILGVITPAIVIAYALFSDKIGALIDSVRAILG